MAALERIAANLRTVLAAHVAFQFMDRRCLRSPHDVEGNGLMRVAAKALHSTGPPMFTFARSYGTMRHALRLRMELNGRGVIVCRSYQSYLSSKMTTSFNR